MDSLENLRSYSWFDQKYDFAGSRPTLEDRAELLSGLGIKISFSQLEKMRRTLGDTLHQLGRGGNCSPALTTIAYHLISCLASSSDVSSQEIRGYIHSYKKVIEQRCPHLKQNFE